MILEHAILNVREGEGQAFEAAFSQGRKLIAASPGFQSLQLLRCIEDNRKFLLLIYWHSVADHEQGFRGSAAYEEWRRLLHHFYKPFPVVKHFALVPPAS